MVAAARMPAMGIEACEDDTRLHFDVESDLPRFLDSVQRTDQISQTKADEEMWSSILLLSIKRCVCFVYPKTAVRILTPMTKKPVIISHQHSAMSYQLCSYV